MLVELTSDEVGMIRDWTGLFSYTNDAMVCEGVRIIALLLIVIFLHKSVIVPAR